jgi:hypothetical protein
MENGPMAMQRYIVECGIPGIESFTEEGLRATAISLCDAQQAIGPNIEWIESFVAEARLYSHYRATDEAVLREHGHRMGLRVDRISKVHARLDPGMAGGSRLA